MVVMLRTSERRTFKRCPTQWWWAWRMGLKRHGMPKDPLWFGTGVHVALAEWYRPGTRRGVHPVETWRQYCAQSGDVGLVATQERLVEMSAGRHFTEERMVEAAELGETMLAGYVEHYGTDESWDVIQPEYSTQIEIPHPTKPGEIIVLYCLTYDGVYRDLATRRGDLFLMEHKTAKTISLSHLPLDDQAGSYWAVAAPTVIARGLVPPGTRLRGITYNFLRKALPDDRPRDAQGYALNAPTREQYLEALAHVPDVRQRMKASELREIAEREGIEVQGVRSKIQPKSLFVRQAVYRSDRERKTQIRRIADEALWMQAIRDRTLPLTKTPTNNCAHDCDFFDLCQLHEQNAPGWRDFLRDAYRVEDPYADHRTSTDQ